MKAMIDAAESDGLAALLRVKGKEKRRKTKWGATSTNPT